MINLGRSFEKSISLEDFFLVAFFVKLGAFTESIKEATLWWRNISAQQLAMSYNFLYNFFLDLINKHAKIYKESILRISTLIWGIFFLVAFFFKLGNK